MMGTVRAIRSFSSMADSAILRVCEFASLRLVAALSEDCARSAMGSTTGRTTNDEVLRLCSKREREKGEDDNDRDLHVSTSSTSFGQVCVPDDAIILPRRCKCARLVQSQLRRDEFRGRDEASDGPANVAPDR